MLTHLVALALSSVEVQAGYEGPPINYRTAKPQDVVAKLDPQRLEPDDDFGYLQSFLKALDVPASSQVLVFSKTSFQLRRISPRSPRAIYFNDDVYVGWVRGGEVLEVSAVDPQLGSVFYTVAQEGRPRIERQMDACLQCHDSRGLTLGVPGHIVRSVYPSGDGTPRLSLGTFRTTYQSPWKERWGGWYVTGESGAMRHLGNATFPEDASVEPAATRSELGSRMDVDAYLAPTSDIVALMVLEHQTYVHNLITRANHETRVALVQCEDINRLTGDPPGTLTEGTRSRIRWVNEPLVEALFFAGEPPLPSPVKGDTSFAADFAKRGPLRRFDLRRRLFALPFSYMVFSKAFAGLPDAARGYVLGRVRDVLSGRDASAPFAHLSAEERAAILKVLRDSGVLKD
jgi:hypothetical protein